MKAIGGKFSNKKAQAIVALLEEPTIKEAAQTVGIAEATIFRWLQDPGFQKTYREAKRQLVNTAIARLQKITGEAVEALRQVMNDLQTPPSSRVMAARTVLEMAIRAVEIEGLEARVEDLENRLIQNGGKS
jgi:DNA-binding MurR/RpiR family transcriptional regulator